MYYIYFYFEKLNFKLSFLRHSYHQHYYHHQYSVQFPLSINTMSFTDFLSYFSYTENITTHTQTDTHTRK